MILDAHAWQERARVCSARRDASFSRLGRHAACRCVSRCFTASSWLRSQQHTRFEDCGCAPSCSRFSFCGRGCVRARACVCVSVACVAALCDERCRCLGMEGREESLSLYAPWSRQSTRMLGRRYTGTGRAAPARRRRGQLSFIWCVWGSAHERSSERGEESRQIFSRSQHRRSRKSTSPDRMRCCAGETVSQLELKDTTPSLCTLCMRTPHRRRCQPHPARDPGTPACLCVGNSATRQRACMKLKPFRKLR